MLPYHFRTLTAGLAFAALALNTAPANAKSSACSPEYESQIRAAFFDGSRVSNAKVDAYIGRLKQKKSEIASIIEGKVELKADSKGKVAKAKKLKKAVGDSKSLFALDQAIAAAESMKSASSFAKVCDAATAISDYEGAIRIEGAELPFAEAIRTAKAVLSTWKIPKRSPPSDEASNLVSSNGAILSSSDIASAVARGVDLSLLQPAPGSVFYTPVKNIPSVDVRKAALGSTISAYSGLGNVFPADNTFVYENMKKSATKPKMDAHVEGDKRTKFKLKFEAEYNADPTVGALMMTLGFPSDLSKYAKHIKLVLPKGTSIHDLKRDWESYFSRDRVIRKDGSKIESLIESVSTDKRGRTVIVFKEGSIEAHPTSLKRIGSWKYSDGDHLSRREVRAMTLVQMWLDNSDLKEFDNNNTLVKTNADGSVTRTLFNSDVGHSLGWLYLETPSLYSWNMITSTSGSTIDFRYRQMHPVSVKDKITLADARWGARLIAQLSREQIATAVALGGWPDCVQKAYVEKVVSRRNDLVTGLGLLGARQADGSVIRLLPVASDRKAYDIENICQGEQSQKNSVPKYGFSAGSFIDPILITAKRQLFDLARSSLGGEKRLVIKSKDFHWGGPRPIAEVIFNINREIERNPSPRTEQDLFIVNDHFELGVRAGVAVGPYADVVERYSWELAYPARSQQEAGMNNGFIVNLLLPRDAREGRLPDSYVLKTEHSFEVGSGVQADNLASPLSPAVQAGLGRVKAWRSIYDHRDGSRAVLYRDRQDFTQAELDIFARIAILKIPVLEQLKSWGNAIGKGVILSSADLKDPSIEAAVDRAVVEGDFTSLANRETDFFSGDEFKHSLRKWSLLVWHSRSEKRLDRIEIDTDNKKNVVQFKTSKGSKVSFLTSKVEKNVAVELFADPMHPEDMELQVNVMGTDVKTSDKEMADKYLRFVNGLSVDGRKVINLTPSLGYTTNGNWGDTLTQSNTTYSAEAMKRILGASSEQFWSALSRSMGVSRSALNAMRAGADRTHAQDVVIDHAKAFLKQIARAQAERSFNEKIEKLAEAFRKAVFLDRTGFYNPYVLGALNRIAGETAIYSRNLITVPEPMAMNTLEGTPAFGRIGVPMKDGLKYLIFAPVTALDLYNMFDTWF